MAFAAAAVEALLEQADFGLQVVDLLLELGLALRQARRGGGAAVGALGLELGLALGGAAVEGLVEAGLLAGVGEGPLAGRQATGGRRRGPVGGARFPKGE